MRPWWSRKNPADLVERVVDFLHAFLLLELAKGVVLTGRNLFARKVVVRYPEEKTPSGPR